MKLLKQYRINKLEEYIVKLDAEINTIDKLFGGASEIGGYYADKLIEAYKLKAKFELKLKRLKENT